MTYEYEMDNNFLREICSQRNRIVYTKITAYNNTGGKIGQIEGYITSGTVNIDGSSSVRRTCSLTINVDDNDYNNMFFNNLNIHDFQWGLETTVSIEVGLENFTQQYLNHKIIWFKMGYYYITSFSTSLSTQGRTINLNCKDKMCKLNGELGGTFTAPTRLDIEDELLDDYIVHKKVPLKKLIQLIVSTYGQEQYGKIIVNDLDDYALALQTYYGYNTWYLFEPQINKEKNDIIYYPEFNENEDSSFILCSNREFLSDSNYNKLTKEQKEQFQNQINSFKNKNDDIDLLKFPMSIYPDIAFDKRNNLTENKGWFFRLLVGDKSAKTNVYTAKKVNYGDNFGYKITDIIYPSELLANIGDTVVTILDKIKNILGNYEYFYDVDGNFIFQEKKNVNNIISFQNDINKIVNAVKNKDNLEDFNFSKMELMTAISNQPNFNNIKNDFSIWGERKTGNSTVPFHVRYAIDEKPTYYKSIAITEERIDLLKKEKVTFAEDFSIVDSIFYYTNSYIGKLPSGITAKKCDWREIIYQMAQDNKKLNASDYYTTWLREANPRMTNGTTGYEQYYIDIDGFWRDLYRYDWDAIDITQYQPEELMDLFKEGLTFKRYGGNTNKFNYTVNNLEQKYVYRKDGDKMINLGNINDIIKTNYMIYFCWQLTYAYYSKLYKYARDNNDNLYNALIDKYQEFIDGITLYLYNENTTFYYDDSEEKYILVSKEEHKYHPLTAVSISKLNLDGVANAGMGDTFTLTETINKGESVVTNLRIRNFKYGNNRYSSTSSGDYRTYNFIKKNYRRGKANGEIGDKSYIFGSGDITQRCTWYHKVFKADGNFIFKELGTYEPIAMHSESNAAGNYYFCEQNFSEVDLATLELTITNQSSYEITIQDSGVNETYILTQFNKENSNTALLFAPQKTTLSNFSSMTGKMPTHPAMFTMGTSKSNLINAYDTNVTFIANFASSLFNMENQQKEMLWSWPDNFDRSTYWNRDVLTSPETLPFWIDFLDNNSIFNKYSVKKIGQRQKTVVDKNIKLLDTSKINNLIIIDPTDDRFNTLTKVQSYVESKKFKTGYNYVQLGTQFINQLGLSSTPKTAVDVLNNLLYECVLAQEQISISAIPLYFLQPNSIVAIEDSYTNIFGRYYVNKITIPLGYNGTMSLNGTRVNDELTRFNIYLNG